MSPWVIALIVALAAIGSLTFSTLSYALREMSRVRLGTYLEKQMKSEWLEPTVEHAGELILVTAILRLFSNIVIVLGVLGWFQRRGVDSFGLYVWATVTAGVIMTVVSVAVPNALARHAGDSLIGGTVGFLHALRRVMFPLTKLLHVIDELVRRATGASVGAEPEQIQQEILSVVEEGEKEGIVDEQEREMIVSVIRFRDTTAGQIMTARPEIVGLEVGASLAQVKQTIEESGHSRIPMYEGTLDHVVGVLYARDLLQFLGQSSQRFDIRAAIRPTYFVPETKSLSDLLRDFRLQKVHIAIVLDEYGGTAGLVTIEDILEELVGDISDEHEPVEPAMFKRIDENTAEADARIYLDELNRLAGLSLPEDAGYDTLGGFVSTTLGRIPEPGTAFEHAGAKFTVLDAEPRKVNRVRIEVIPEPAEAEAVAPQGK